MSVTRRAVLAAPFLHLASRAAATRPNVVMFMTDDHSAWATGAYGCAEMQTPHIDALAAGGARFTRAFAATPVCSPSRFTYLTGRMPSTHGVQDWLRPVDSFGPNSRNWLAGHPTYSEVLARNGYTLGLSGKWHMGEDEKAQAGFTYWATIPGGGGPYRDVTFVRNGQRIAYPGFKTDGVGDYALEFLDQQKADQPFYLYVPFYAPHTPYNYQPEAYRKPYENSPFSCFPNLPKHPSQNPGLAQHHGNRDSKHAFSALVRGVDHTVGRVVEMLERKGLRGNTTLVFTSDQGWAAGHRGVWGKGNGTWPLNMYEPAIHVPMIWNHPGRIPEGIAPAPMISSYDYLPTLLDYLGVKSPADPKSPGRSYAAFLRGRNPRWDNRLYFEYRNVRAVRTEHLKYIERTREHPSELWDLEADPDETRNRIGEPAYRKQVDNLRLDLARFFTGYGAPPLEQWQTTTKQELTEYGR
ncbi:MAG: sulfatase-like hydrolase/transferase [Bryobacterales bacterium]|nr:sulfatase-like hydrolase/transferase [Bryobacterales bacterium]